MMSPKRIDIGQKKEHILAYAAKSMKPVSLSLIWAQFRVQSNFPLINSAHIAESRS